ncbi:MAG: tetratricopeptide repeat protein [Pelagibacteraceae bacterium]
MKKIKNHILIILQIFFFLSIFNGVCAKNFDKFLKSDNINNYFSGILYIQDNDYANSYKYLKKLKGLEKDHYGYSKIYQYSLVNTGRFEEAFNYSKKLEIEGLDNFESNLIIAIYYLKNNNFKNAQKYFKKLNQNNSNETLPGFLAESLNIWSKFMLEDKKINPNLIDGIHNRFKNIKKIQKTFAYCFSKSPKADLYFKKLITNEEINFSRYNFFYANYLNNNKKKLEAINVINKSLHKYPKNILLNQLKIDLNTKKINKFNNKFDCTNISDVVAEIFYVVSNALSSQSLYSTSNFYLNLSKYLNGQFISFDILHAENFYLSGNLTKAKIIYNKIKKRGEIYGWYSSKQIARILIKQDNQEEALKILEKEFNKLPGSNVYNIYEYADFLKNNKKFKESLIFFNEVLNTINNQHPLFSKASEGRGVAYERLGNWKKAEQDLLQSLNVKPKQAYVMNYLAYSWIEKGINIEKSLEMLEEANQIKKNDGYIIDSLGWALFKLQKYKKAEKHLKKAVILMPSDPVVNDHFADVLWMNSKKIQARYYWNYVLNLKEAEKELKESIKLKLIFGPKLKI